MNKRNLVLSSAVAALVAAGVAAHSVTAFADDAAAPAKAEGKKDGCNGKEGCKHKGKCKHHKKDKKTAEKKAEEKKEAAPAEAAPKAE